MNIHHNILIIHKSLKYKNINNLSEKIMLSILIGKFVYIITLIEK